MASASAACVSGWSSSLAITRAAPLSRISRAVTVSPRASPGSEPANTSSRKARDLQGLVALRPDLVALAGQADGLHGHGGGQAEDHREAGRRRRDPGPVAADELPRAVAQGVRLRRHRQVLAVAPQVLGQEPDRCVAPAGLLAQRHQDDVVEVAPQPPPQLRGAEAARLAQRFLVGPLGGAMDGGTRSAVRGRRPCWAARDPARRRRAGARPSRSRAGGRADWPVSRTYSRTPSE